MRIATLPLACVLMLGSAASIGSAADPAPQRTTLESAFGEFWSVGNETFFVFKSSPAKRVTLTGTNLKLVCDHLEITASGLGAKPGKSDPAEQNATLPNLEKFKYLLATGNVQIVQGEREATAGRAEVFPREDRIVLTEKPVITDHGNDTVANGVVSHANDYVQRGSKITMYRGDRKVVIENNEFEGPAIRNLGFDKEQPVPKPAPTAPNSPTTAPPAEASPTVTVPGLPQKK